MKVILFDCFGVLSSPVYTNIFKKYVSDTAERQVWIDKLVDLDTGILAESDLIDQISDYTGISTSDLWLEVKNSPVLNYELFDFIKNDLKGTYKLGLLTNIATGLINRIMSPEQLALFDIALISSELGIAKPDPRIYQIAIERSEVPANEILFIDDREENIIAAKKEGLNGIIYTDLVSLKEDLNSTYRLTTANK